VAGTATAGIPHAAWIADRLKKPMVYVRNKPKEHGKHNVIEGKLDRGQTVLVVEDLVSTGKSSVAAGLALREAGVIVNDCIAIFNYQLTTALEQFTTTNINLYTLSNFSSLLEVATAAGYINEEEKSMALTWKQNPNEWGKQR
jgi:orotate phosphoribosyltransferase